MIAIDTSALMAILLDEPSADACARRIESEDRVIISAGTLAEALIVSARRDLEPGMLRLTNDLGFEVVAVTKASAARVAEAYERFGKGVHPAALNFGDCFAYALAREQACPLLYVGADFAKTDIIAAL